MNRKADAYEALYRELRAAVLALEFTECDSCRKKAGTPLLCGGCVKTRHNIYKVKGLLK